MAAGPAYVTWRLVGVKVFAQASGSAKGVLMGMSRWPWLGPLLFAQHSCAIGTTMQKPSLSFTVTSERHRFNKKRSQTSAFFLGRRADLACRMATAVRKNRTGWSHRGTDLAKHSLLSGLELMITCSAPLLPEFQARLTPGRRETDKLLDQFRVSHKAWLLDYDGGVSGWKKGGRQEGETDREVGLCRWFLSH